MTIEKDWRTKAGLRAVVLMTELGHRCGYVGIPTTHPLHGVEYDQRHESLKLDPNRSTEKMSPLLLFAAAGSEIEELNRPDYVFEVHGGITYSGGSAEYPAESGNLWWFGYDCGHAGDAPDPASTHATRMQALGFANSGGIHRSLDYCIDECESLAKQLSEVGI